jgi:exopolyphosphatase / guanosine-5'-triphosphate,3'-diphosphate pyrophosphatase
VSDQAGKDGAASGPIAVVEVGSTGIRMLLARADGKGGFKVIDRAGKPLALGRDVFTAGTISRDTASRCIAILKGFREALGAWGVESSSASCIATSALREARNRETFIDRVALRTGFRIETVEGIEEIRLMHLAIRHALSEKLSDMARSNSMVIEVGGGSTEIMLLKRNRMAAAHSLGLGTVRIQQQAKSTSGTGRFLSRYLEEGIATACERLSSEFRLDSARNFICIGSDARLAAERAGTRAGEAFWTVPRKAFIEFEEGIAASEPEELAASFRVPLSEAEGMAPGLHVARLFLEKTQAKEVIVPDASIREGMIVSLSAGPDGLEGEEAYRSQVIASAKALGKRYRYDEPHSLHVAALSLAIFDGLEAEHGLGPHERLLLEVGAILHDIGAFIRTSGHHKHSEYIVTNSEIFGLRRDDTAILSNLVRYHRKQTPQPSHPNFTSLPPASRTVVMKLSAILRVADALDRGHGQRISIKAIEKTETGITLRTAEVADLSLERYSLAEKADLLEEVFGFKAALA